MSKRKPRKAKTLSVMEIMAKFPDNAAATAYIEQIRWPTGVRCAHCHSPRTSRLKRQGFHQCRACRKQFSVRHNSIFERSHIHLHKWLYAIYTILTARKGVSALQLSKEIGVSHRAAWFMGHRIREACKHDGQRLFGAVEVDEGMFGGRNKSRHENKKLEGLEGKVRALIMKQRHGGVVAKVIANGTRKEIFPKILNNVLAGSIVYSDCASTYVTLPDFGYYHKSVNHSAKEYVRGAVSTNGAESYWGLIRRAYQGTYHMWSDKHAQRYLDEASARLDIGNVEIDTEDRMRSLIRKSFGKRLTFREMVDDAGK